MYQQHPHISLSVLETMYESMFSLLNNHIIDIGLLGIHGTDSIEFTDSFIQDNELLYVQKLFTDSMVCVMEKTHPLAIHNFLTTEQVASQKLTIYGSAPSFMSSIEAFHISTNMKVHQQFMKNANTICTMPYHAYLSFYPQDDYIYLPILDAEPINTYLVCNQLSREKHPELYQAFIDTVSSVTQEKNKNRTI